MEFLLSIYEEDYSTVPIINEQECSGSVTIKEASELVPLENFIAQMIISERRKEKIKVVHRGILSIWKDFRGAKM